MHNAIKSCVPLESSHDQNRYLIFSGIELGCMLDGQQPALSQKIPGTPLLSCWRMLSATHLNCVCNHNFLQNTSPENFFTASVCTLSGCKKSSMYFTLLLIQISSPQPENRLSVIPKT